MYKNSKSQDKEYELPDGRVVTVTTQRWRCPEALFDPLVLGKEMPSFPRITVDSILKCDFDVRRELYSNIVMSGGTTMFTNIETRLHNEILKNKDVPIAIHNTVKVIAPPERKFLVWIGGSILSSLSTFQNMWITKQEYEENGKEIVHRKCF